MLRIPPCNTWPRVPAWRSRTRWCSRASSKRRGATSMPRSGPTSRSGICAPRASRSLRGSSATSSTRAAARAICAIICSRRGRPRLSGRWTGFTAGSKFDHGIPSVPLLLFLVLVLVPPHHPNETGAEAHEQHQENGRGERVGLDRGLRSLGARGRKQERSDRSGKESFHGGLSQRPFGERARINLHEAPCRKLTPVFQFAVNR